METMLYAAAALTVLIGCAHSYLGEKFILQRLFRNGNLPPLFGGTEFTQNTLRFAWHLTTVAWWGFAALLIMMADSSLSASRIGQVIAIVFGIHFLVALIASRGRHFAWIVFLLIAGLAWTASC
ncbi:MAG: hypothetical protein HOH58_11555 [Opitutaceae bacterium]|jgi:hypothetical protein|nr:hypothetical protein [Opitutaceae bacterium]